MLVKVAGKPTEAIHSIYAGEKSESTFLSHSLSKKSSISLLKVKVHVSLISKGPWKMRLLNRHWTVPSKRMQGKRR